jgi:integrase
MSKPLTAVAVEKLKAKPKRFEVPDGGQRGLKVVVFPSGQKSFVVRYRFGGVKRKLTLGHIPLAAARKAAGEALYEVAQGRDPALAARTQKAAAADLAKDTVKAICGQYLHREGGKLRTGETRRAAFERLVYPVIGHIPVSALRRSDVVKLLDRIEDSSGSRAADLTLGYLRRVLNWHAARADSFNSPLIRGMGRYSTAANSRTRVLDDAELRALWQATGTPAPFHALVRFLLLTAARRDEARRLIWDEIDGDLWHLPAQRSKTGVAFTRPLSGAAKALLAAQPRIDGCPFVFSNDGRTAVSVSWAKADLDRASGVSSWRLHDLRRSGRTLLSRAGVDADIAERCLGHKIAGIRGVYDKFAYQAEMLKAFEALAALVQRIVNPQENVVPIGKRS